MEEFNNIIIDIIETKRKEINNNKKNSHSDDHHDVLTSMLEIGEQEGIRTDIKQLRDEMVALFVAGHDSKSKSIFM
jgi:cytochrome P450